MAPDPPPTWPRPHPLLKYRLGRKICTISRCAVVTAALLSPALPQTEQTISVTAVRFWSLGGVTRVAIESSAQVEYRSDRLSNPDRIYFDLRNAINRVGPRRRVQHVIPVGDGILKQIRIAETQRNTRVVFDLHGNIEVAVSQLANPDRLIVELRPAEPKPIVDSTSLPATGPSLPDPPEMRVSKAVPRNSPPPVGMPGLPPPQKQEIARSVPVAKQAPANEATRTPVTVDARRAPPAAEPAAMETEAPVGLPAKRDSLGNRSMVRALGLKIGRVIIDPGHGGHDTGTIGSSGLMEKDVALDVAKRLGALIEERLGSEVFLTRTDDTFIRLDQRTAIANEKRADLFLSIHANSSSLRSVSGVETFYLNFTTSRADLEVAARENASSQKTVHELSELLQKIALKDKIQESREFASSVQSALYPLSANTRAKNRGVKKAPFLVLIGASMPSVLTEIGFLTNPREEGLLRKPEYRQRIAEALYKGVSQYASTLSHFQVAQRED